MKNEHEPNEVFISDLEKQLASELRRRNRFRSIDHSAGVKRVLRVSVLFILCMATGVAAAKTVEHIESAKRKELLLARAATTIEVIRAQQEVAQEVLEEVEKRVQAEVSHQRELWQAVHQSNLLKYELERAQLDLEEVNLSSQPPSNKLFAPLQRGRDFVSARLGIDYRAVSDEKARLADGLARLQELEAEGLVQPSEVSRSKLQLERVAGELENIRRQLRLREAFLSGELTAKQAGRRQMLYEAMTRLQIVESATKEAEAHFEEVSKARERGLISAIEVKQAEQQVVSTRAERRLARIELEFLKEQLDE